jgi:hypothetical protein
LQEASNISGTVAGTGELRRLGHVSVAGGHQGGSNETSGSPYRRDCAPGRLAGTRAKEWGPKLTKYKYIYSNSRVYLVEPASRKVINDID